METKVANVRDVGIPDHTKPTGLGNPDPVTHVFIGRPGKWGNPYIIGVDGNREECIRKYERLVLSNRILLQSLPEIAGNNLICYCSPQPCHGDILANLVKKYVRIKTK
jgi:hypothetical protein